ncbi:MAG: CPBP family intramembrane metalloprotease [Lachnospiraceae bacterium]|nr:CPBP family intramembrane metalloprotease [Lachnospiraceae bacterium]
MRPDRKPGFFTMLWGLLYPFLLYQGIVTAISIAVGSLVLAGNFESLAASVNGSSFYAVLQNMIYEHYGLIAGVGALCTLPILIYLYHYDTGKEKRCGMHEEWENVPFFHFIIVLIMGAAVCLALNHLFIYSRLTELLQDSYEETASLLFQGKLILEIAVAGVIIPIVEELIFRGLAYRRMRWYIKPVPAMILSALYFGAVHGNWLQGIYAFIMGMLLAFAYERFHSILAPTLIHIGANTVSVIISETELLNFVYEDDTAFLIATVIAAAVFVITFYIMVTYVWPRKTAEASATASNRPDGIQRR